MHTNIESHLVEKRVFKPSKDFAKNTRIKSLDQYRRMYRESIKQPNSGRAKRASWSGARRGKKFSTGTRHSQSGLSVANSTFRKIVWIGT